MLDFSFSKAAGKAHKSILKYAGLAGIPFYILLNASMSKVSAVDPSATLVDGLGDFYGGLAYAAVEHFIPGVIFTLSETFRYVGLATDFVTTGGVGTLTQAFASTVTGETASLDLLPNIPTLDLH